MLVIIPVVALRLRIILVPLDVPIRALLLTRLFVVLLRLLV